MGVVAMATRGNAPFALGNVAADSSCSIVPGRAGRQDHVAGNGNMVR